MDDQARKDYLMKPHNTATEFINLFGDKLDKLGIHEMLIVFYEYYANMTDFSAKLMCESFIRKEAEYSNGHYACKFIEKYGNIQLNRLNVLKVFYAYVACNNAFDIKTYANKLMYAEKVRSAQNGS